MDAQLFPLATADEMFHVRHALPSRDREGVGAFAHFFTTSKGGGALLYFSDTNRAIPKAAAAANPPMTMVRNAPGTSGIPV